MSKWIVYLLDKFVCMLLITVLTTQALQIVGVVEGPKSLGQITYPEERPHEFKLTVGDSRAKRQAQRFPVLDNIFNIPIATLSSVNNLLQSAGRLGVRTLANIRAPRKIERDREQIYFEGPRVQADGSSSRVLLNV